jgi:hypothetical protein
MTRILTTGLRTAALAGLLAMGGLAATTSAASAHYRTTRCDRDGDRCVVLRCDDDGDRCNRISRYYRGYGYGHRYHYRHGQRYWHGHRYHHGRWYRRHHHHYRWGD